MSALPTWPPARFIVPLFVFLAFGCSRSMRADDTEGALARMDQIAATFKGMSAAVQMTQYTKLLDTRSTQDGTLQMQRTKNSEVRAILDFPKEQTLAYTGRNLTIFYPQTGELQKYSASKLGVALNQFLLLGFGSSGRELKTGYMVTSDGSESINGQKAVKLLLIPRDPKVLEKLPKVELWVPETAGYPIQQQFWEPTSGNYRLLTYSNIKINPPISGNLEFKPPSGAKKSR